jgi:hypothetical protein
MSAMPVAARRLALHAIATAQRTVPSEPRGATNEHRIAEAPRSVAIAAAASREASARSHAPAAWRAWHA